MKYTHKCVSMTEDDLEFIYERKGTVLFALTNL